MPKLGEYQYLLDIVFFLYPDEESAREGKQAGGTGFFVTLQSPSYPDQHHYPYAVTNWHVAVERGNSVIRVNRSDGGVAIFPFEPHEWEFIPGGYDIAAIPIELTTGLKMEAIEFSSFCLTAEDVTKLEINAADDIFMLGRFVDWDGAEMNQPSMRFGNISMMEAAVKQPTGCRQPSLVVDMHSRTGFSGSPVFIYRTAGSIFAEAGTIMGGGHLMKLLGILWGAFPESWGIKDAQSKIAIETTAAALHGKEVTGWSGMSLVAPAPAIGKLLNCDRFKVEREEAEKALEKVFGGSPVVLDLSLPKS